MNIRFFSKGPPEQISGGYLYNKYVLDYLRLAGAAVTYHADAGGVDDPPRSFSSCTSCRICGETEKRTQPSKRSCGAHA
jgi:hypothetical protein